MSTLDDLTADTLIDIVRATRSIARDMTRAGLVPMVRIDPPEGHAMRTIEVGAMSVGIVGADRAHVLSCARAGGANRAARDWLATPPDGDAIRLVVSFGALDLLVEAADAGGVALAPGAALDALLMN